MELFIRNDSTLKGRYCDLIFGNSKKKQVCVDKKWNERFIETFIKRRNNTLRNHISNSFLIRPIHFVSEVWVTPFASFSQGLSLRF